VYQFCLNPPHGGIAETAWPKKTNVWDDSEGQASSIYLRNIGIAFIRNINITGPAPV